MSVFLIILATPPEERPDDWVDASYVATRTGLSERTILAGHAKFNVPPVNRKPMRWHRATVDKWLRQRAEGAIEASKPKRLSLITRKKRSA